MKTIKITKSQFKKILKEGRVINEVSIPTLYSSFTKAQGDRKKIFLDQMEKQINQEIKSKKIYYKCYGKDEQLLREIRLEFSRHSSDENKLELVLNPGLPQDSERLQYAEINEKSLGAFKSIFKGMNTIQGISDIKVYSAVFEVPVNFSFGGDKKIESILKDEKGRISFRIEGSDHPVPYITFFSIFVFPFETYGKVRELCKKIEENFKSPVSDISLTFAEKFNSKLEYMSEKGTTNSDFSVIRAQIEIKNMNFDTLKSYEVWLDPIKDSINSMLYHRAIFNFDRAVFDKLKTIGIKDLEEKVNEHNKFYEGKIVSIEDKKQDANENRREVKLFLKRYENMPFNFRFDSSKDRQFQAKFKGCKYEDNMLKMKFEADSGVWQPIYIEIYFRSNNETRIKAYTMSRGFRGKFEEKVSVDRKMAGIIAEMCKKVFDREIKPYQVPQYR